MVNSTYAFHLARLARRRHLFTHRQFQRVYRTLCDSLEFIEQRARSRGIHLARRRPNVQPTSEPQPGTSREPEAGPSSAPTHQSPTQENSPTRTPKAPAVAQSRAQSVESPESPEPEAAQERTAPQPALVVPVARPLEGAERDEKLEYFLQSKVGHYSDEFFEIRKIALAMGEGYAADLADRLCSFEKYLGENHIMQLAKAGT
jgi:hypothetical protein